MPPVVKLIDQNELVDTAKYPYAKFPFEKFNPVQSRIFDFYDKETSGVIASATSSGKAQPLTSKVLTPDGFVQMGQLKVGDPILGRDEKVYRITGVYPQGKKKVYRVRFNDGAYTDCCEDHLWAVRTKYDQSYSILSLKDINLNRKWFIPLSKSLSKKRWIRGVEEVGIAECQCIAVSTPDHLYVTDNYIVTHNTITAELFLAHEIHKRGGKGMYLAPMRALAQEKYDDWTSESHHFGNRKVSICTGDYRLTSERLEELEQADIIIMSSEMVSHRARNAASEKSQFLSKVGTLVVDECFPGKTLVRVEGNIDISIKDIVENNDIQYVLAYDFSSNKVVKKRILRKIKKERTNGLVAIRHEYGKFSCTKDHKIWTNRGYIKACELTERDSIKWIPLINSNHCPVCDKSFSKKSGLASHYMYGHISPGKNAAHTDLTKTCDKCGKDISIYGYQSHLNACGIIKENKYIPKSPECLVCGKIFESASSRAIHEMHHNYSQAHYDLMGEKLAVNPKYITSMKNMGTRRTGKNNPIFRNPGSYEKFLTLGAIRWASLTEEEKQEQINRFISAPRRKTSGTSFELLVESTLADLPVKRTSGGKLWLTFKSGKRKNPDFIVEGFKKVIEIGDTDYWHTKEEIESVVKQYAEIGYQCLYLTSDDVRLGKDHIRTAIVNFVDNHESRVLSVRNWGKSGIDEVYDLEIEDCHNYFANGVLVSNCHLLTVPGRGPHLESGLMKFTEINNNARLILLSATMPNVGEIADWVSYSLTKRDTFLLTSTYRPCPLNLHYEKYSDSENYYEGNELQKVHTALGIVQYYPNDKFLIFAHTKRTGELMKSAILKLGIDCEFHNADLEKAKRLALEVKFKTDPKFRVVIATSTLAWGCYSVGSQIRMANGELKLLEDVKVNDLVLSYKDPLKYDVVTGSPVIKIGERFTGPGYKVTLVSGETMVVSEDHKFLAFNGRIDWHCIKDLKVQDCLAELNLAYLSDIYIEKAWRSIKSIEPIQAEFIELEVDKTHNYIGNGVISHNCNLPARRVILLGVHRGLSEVATYDISQAVGRAGRPAFDPVGDAYILLPEKTYDLHKARLKKPQNIISQMLDDTGGKHKVLAFHLVSEIHQGFIKDRDDVYHWYKRTLASFQSHELDDKVIDDVIALLKKYNAIWEENGIYSITPIGKVASLFYYSPFDVSDLKKNFSFLFEDGKENDDYFLSIALGNVDTQKGGIVSRVERDEMSRYSAVVKNLFPSGTLFEPVIKAGFCYYLLLNGRSNTNLAGMCRGLQFDFPRLNQVLQSIDSFCGKWGKREWFKELQLRITYGVSGPLVNLCQLPNIGKARSTKLWNAGIRSMQDVVNNPGKVKSILGLKDKMIQEIMLQATALSGSHLLS